MGEGPCEQNSTPYLRIAKLRRISLNRRNRLSVCKLPCKNQVLQLGKLPRETVSVAYDLEYGKAEVEIHKDAIRKGTKVVIVDDLIATGGTLEAACKLVESLGGEVVKISVVMELSGLEGRKKLSGYNLESLICYEGK